METARTTPELRQHELVIMRRLRQGPLTEFELAAQVSEHSGFACDEAARRITGWLTSLHERGLIWLGQLFNRRGLAVHAAALTSLGRDVVD